MDPPPGGVDGGIHLGDAQPAGQDWTRDQSRSEQVGSLTPDLATSWEQPDDTSYVFRLADANFHDIAPVSGRPVTSQDVKFMIDAHLDAEEPQFFRQHEFADATVETPDEKTAVDQVPGAAGAVLEPHHHPRHRGPAGGGGRTSRGC